MNRKEELQKIVFKEGTDNEIKATRLIDEIIFLEEQMDYLRSLPFISFSTKHPKDKSLQKATPASKMYKEMLQQYNNSMRLLLRITGDLEDQEGESPLRKWAKSRGGFEE